MQKVVTVIGSWSLLITLTITSCAQSHQHLIISESQMRIIKENVGKAPLFDATQMGRAVSFQKTYSINNY